jgi:hypothetical protein
MDLHGLLQGSIVVHICFPLIYTEQTGSLNIFLHVGHVDSIPDDPASYPSPDSGCTNCDASLEICQSLHVNICIELQIIPQRLPSTFFF